MPVLTDDSRVEPDLRPDQRSRRGVSIALLVLLYLLLGADLLWRMNIQDIERFDEARHAVNAYEMLRSGNFIANMWRGALDYWNLKPPLSFWVDALSFKVFGFTPFALRLPSALAAFGTTALVTTGARRLGGRAAAVIATAAMATCYPLITTHSWRTGDPDALFVLFLTAGLLGVLLAPRRPWALLALTLGFSLAFLTKSFHSGLLLVFAIGYLVATRRGSAVRLRHLAGSLLGFLPLIAWAVARFLFDGTTFFVGMVREDLLTRSSTPIEGNSGSPLYYVRLLVHFYGIWLLVALLAVVALALLARRSGTIGGGRPFMSVRPEVVGLLVWALLVIGAFSVVATKLPWYTLPAYPAMAILVGLALGALLQTGSRRLATAAAVAGVLALLVSQALVTRALLAVQPDPVQQAFAAVHRDPAHRLEAVYLDPAIKGGWRQERVASAELNGDLVPEAGRVPAFQRAPHALLLVRAGSSTDRAHPELRARQVARASGYYLTER